MSARPLTPAQLEQLKALLETGAISRDMGKGVHARDLAVCNPVVIGKLRDRGLADSRTVRAGEQGMHGQFTAYWLTEEGARVAREP